MNHCLKKALVIDDDELFSKPLTKFLQQIGFATTWTTAGYEAVTLFAEDPDRFDLVVLDFLMPDVDGSEIHELLRIQSPDIKIIFACSVFYFDQMMRMLKCPNNTFTEKPFNAYQLARKIDRLFGTK